MKRVQKQELRIFRPVFPFLFRLSIYSLAYTKINKCTNESKRRERFHTVETVNHCICYYSI